jgi:hypothetical protein
MGRDRLSPLNPRADQVQPMKRRRLLLLLVLLHSAGCSFLYYGAENVVNDPYNAAQECAFRNRMRRFAREAWREICKTDGKCYSAAHVEGFEDGFVDFIDADGTGDPPGAAPAHLRRRLLKSDTGQIEIENWFAGFRHGVQVARASGLREKYVMPIPLPPKPPQDPMPPHVVVPIPAADPDVKMVQQVRFVAPTLAREPILGPPICAPD